MTQDGYQVFAIRHGHVHRTVADNFAGGCPDDRPMPMDYFIWVAANERRTIVIDTGFGAGEAARRGRSVTRSVADGLRAIGVDHAIVTDVILTHLHWDHAGNLDLFGAARFHLSEQELRFAAGAAMTDPGRSLGYAGSDVADAVRLVHEGRVRFAGDDEELFPGISVHLVGGHTAGTQVVRIATRRGPIVLASDAAHFYANMSRMRVFPVTDDPDKLLNVYTQQLPALVQSTIDIIPGHDPLVLERYRPAGVELRGWVARLDQPFDETVR